jgi:hypothetical protein
MKNIPVILLRAVIYIIRNWKTSSAGILLTIDKLQAAMASGDIPAMSQAAVTLLIFFLLPDPGLKK